MALQADYLAVVEDRPVMSKRYRLPVIFGQNWPHSSRSWSFCDSGASCYYLLLHNSVGAVGARNWQHIT